MPILNLEQAGEINRFSEGTVLINEQPDIRQGKRNPYMVGAFVTREGSCEFKIWEEQNYKTVVENGPGLYDVAVEGSEFNGSYYLTVKRIRPSEDSELDRADFLPNIPVHQIKTFWREINEQLLKLGLSAQGRAFAVKVLNDPEIGGRFWREGAASYFHDCKIGGLANHSLKMLRILIALLENLPALRASTDLLYLGILFHDIGKIYEYDNLAAGEFWFANHRVRGIELLSHYEEEIETLYDERFYRHLQAIISGHHGEYGDRPTTVATVIIHYIDTLESQVTGLLERQISSRDSKFRGEWGFLEPIELAPDFFLSEAENDDLSQD